jgi:ATP-dependent DNA helicase RecG
MILDRYSFEALWERLTNQDESVLIEAKTCANQIGESVLETISAFANEPSRGGGYIILGAKKSMTNTRLPESMTLIKFNAI